MKNGRRDLVGLKCASCTGVPFTFYLSPFTLGGVEGGWDAKRILSAFSALLPARGRGLDRSGLGHLLLGPFHDRLDPGLFRGASLQSVCRAPAAGSAGLDGRPFVRGCVSNRPMVERCRGVEGPGSKLGGGHGPAGLHHLPVDQGGVLEDLLRLFLVSRLRRPRVDPANPPGPRSCGVEETYPAPGVCCS